MKNLALDFTPGIEFLSSHVQPAQGGKMFRARGCVLYSWKLSIVVHQRLLKIILVLLLHFLDECWLVIFTGHLSGSRSFTHLPICSLIYLLGLLCHCPRFDNMHSCSFLMLKSSHPQAAGQIHSVSWASLLECQGQILCLPGVAETSVKTVTRSQKRGTFYSVKYIS